MNFLVLTTVPWLCKLLTLGMLGEGYMGTLQTIFATSLQIYSPNKQFFIKNALCRLRDDLGYRQEPKTVPTAWPTVCGISLKWQKWYISSLSSSLWQILHPHFSPHPRFSLWVLPLTYVYNQYFMAEQLPEGIILY